MIILAESSFVTPASVVGFSVALAVLAIGIGVFLHRRSKVVAGLFLAICVVSACWVVSSIIAGLVVGLVAAGLWTRIAMVWWFLFLALLLLFSYRFPISIKLLKWPLIVLIFVPTLIALPLSLIESSTGIVRMESGGYSLSYGPFFYFLLVNLVLYLGLTIRNYAIVWNRTGGEAVRKRITFVLVGIFTIIIIGLAAYCVLPAVFGMDFLKSSIFGPIGTVFFVLFLAHAIIRHEMLDLRVIAVELFAFVLILINFVEMLMADNPNRFLLRIFLFVASSATGILLIRSVTSEIKRRKQLQRLAIRLDKSNKELRHLDEMKSEFISIASHQLRTPVSVIRGYLSLIKDGSFGVVGGELKDKLEQIYDMNERLVHLINNLLNISRIEKNAAQFWCSEINLAEIVRRVVGDMEFQTKDKNLKLIFEEPKGDLPNVFADPERLTEVIVNLIDNAIKYTYNGTVIITVSRKNTDPFVVVHVKDTGIGMDPEDTRHVFQKFYRPRRPTDEHKAGLSLGLGLYICSKFLRSMGGEIWIEETAPGKGTTVGFSLPIKASGVCNLLEHENE